MAEEKKKGWKPKKKRLVFIERIPFLLPLILILSFVGGYFFVKNVGIDFRYFVIIIGFVVSFYIFLKTGKFKYFILGIFAFTIGSNLLTSTGILMLSASNYGTTYHESQQQLYCNPPDYTAIWNGGQMVTAGKLDSFTIQVTTSAQFYIHSITQPSMVITYIENNQEQYLWNVFTTSDGDSIVEVHTLYSIESGKTISVRVQVFSQTESGVYYTLPFHVTLSYQTTDPKQQDNVWGSILSGDFSGIVSAILGAFSSFKSFFNFLIYVLPAIVIGVGIFYATIGRDPEGGMKTIFFGAILYGGALMVNIMVAILGYNPLNYLNLAGTGLSLNIGFGLDAPLSLSNSNIGVNILTMVSDFAIMIFLAMVIALVVIDAGRTFLWIGKKLHIYNPKQKEGVVT